jgi:RNA exonuclease 1
VDDKGKCVYDKLIKPKNEVVDYLTKYSGITEEKLRYVTTSLAGI